MFICNIFILLFFDKKIFISNSFIIVYFREFSLYDANILLNIMRPWASKRKLLIINKNDVFIYFIFNFKLLILIFSPFKA